VLRFSAGLFVYNGFDRIRQVIDLSCGGWNGRGSAGVGRGGRARDHHQRADDPE